MNNEILAAINGLRIVRLYYEPGWRTIECHAYGTSTEGHELLRAYQTEGASASGEHVNWKLFRVDRIGKLETLAGTFAGPRPGYKRGDSAMTQIYGQL